MADSTQSEGLIVGIDIAKKVFQLHGAGKESGELIRKKLNRKEFEEFFQNRKPCDIAIEACGGAQHWARLFQKYGHKVVLLHPRAVKAFLRGCKSDAADAQAIFFAMQDPSLHRVGVKTIALQDLETVLAIYHGVTQRITTGINRVRGLLMEYGIVMPKTRGIFFRDIDKALESLKETLREASLETLKEEVEDIRRLVERKETLLKRLQKLIDETAFGKLFLTIPGVGVITAAELSTKLVDPSVFKNGRAFAAYLGIIPGHTGTGGGNVNLSITKHGDRCLRSLLVEGGFSQMRAKLKEQWVISITARKPRKVAAVAIGARIARMAWAIAKHRAPYKPFPLKRTLISTISNEESAQQA